MDFVALVNFWTSSHIADPPAFILANFLELLRAISLPTLADMAEADSILFWCMRWFFCLRRYLISGVMKVGSQLLMVHCLVGKKVSNTLDVAV